MCLNSSFSAFLMDKNRCLKQFKHNLFKMKDFYSAVRQQLIKKSKFCHNTVMVEFMLVALHQLHTNYPPEGYCWKERPSGYFSTSHNTSLFLSTHRGTHPSLSPSDARSIHRFGRGGVTLSPGGVNSRRITFSTPISHVHSHLHTFSTHTYALRYLDTVSYP